MLGTFFRASRVLSNSSATLLTVILHMCYCFLLKKILSCSLGFNYCLLFFADKLQFTARRNWLSRSIVSVFSPVVIMLIGNVSACLGRGMHVSVWLLMKRVLHSKHLKLLRSTTKLLCEASEFLTAMMMVRLSDLTFFVRHLCCIFQLSDICFGLWYFIHSYQIFVW